MRRWLPLAAVACAGCMHDAGIAYQNLQQGDLLLVRREYRDAIPFFDRAIQADPTLADPFLHRGLARRGDGDLDGAITDFGRAGELNPTLGRAFHERARTRIEKLGTDRAELEKAFGPDDPLALNADLDRAVALSNAGGDDTAVLVRAAVRIMRKEDAKAKDDIDRYLRRRPKLGEDVGNAAEAWTRERPVLRFELIDAFARVRPGQKKS